MGQIIITSVCVCVSVCLSVTSPTAALFCIVIRNPKSKIEFVTGQNYTTASPIFPKFFTPAIHFQWQGLNTTVTLPVERLLRLIAQKTLLGGRYAGKVEKFLQMPRSAERISCVNTGQLSLSSLRGR